MTHEPRREELLDLALGLLEPAEARALEAHAAACAACREELASLRTTHRLVASLPPVEAPERGAAVLMAAARQAAAASRPRWVMPRWLAGGALGLAGAAALALLVLRVQGPPATGPLSEDREALLGKAAAPAAPAAIPAAAPPEARAGAGSVAAAAGPGAPPRAIGIDRSAPAVAEAPAGEERQAARKVEVLRSAMADGVTEAGAARGAVAPAGERSKESKAVLDEASTAARSPAPSQAMAPARAAAPRLAAAANERDEAPAPPCRLEQRRRFTRDGEGRVVARLREGRYPAAGGEVALRVEERFGADGRLLGAVVRAGDRQFTIGDAELAAGRLEPLPGVVLARTAAEAEQAPPRCEP